MPAAAEVPLIATLLTNRAWAPVVLAAWDRGDAVLPLNPALPRAQLDALIAQARPTHLLDDDGMHPRADGEPVPADTAAIVCTSGTTGGPKAVEVTRVGLGAMGRRVSAAIRATDRGR